MPRAPPRAPPLAKKHAAIYSAGNLSHTGSMHQGPTSRASLQDGTHPRPQLLREAWADLGGEWGFRHDDDAVGLAERWYETGGFDRRIIVPFPPESRASGIHDTGYHPVVWYSREIDSRDLDRAGLGSQGTRVALRFGAVDYRCSVWIDGRLLGEHEGGHTPFSFDLTDALDPARDTHLLVVRAEDDPFDVEQPRGKQDWELDPHSVWYHRTTGIWQPVWLEAVPESSITSLRWDARITDGSVELSVGLSGRASGSTLSVDVWLADQRLGSVSIAVTAPRTRVRVPLPRLDNGQDYEQLLWSPDHPRLLDARVSLRDEASGLADEVSSYFGLRTVAARHGRFWLNERPVYLRSVLSQGYWPESQLAAPSADALREEVQLILDLGFNAARVHQKIEDPRFLYWADRLGLMLWAEMPSAYEFSPTAVRRLSAEWTEVLARDASHPSIVTWVPLNESWGVQHIASDERAQNYAAALRHLTLAIDPSRPVVSNDGWEHGETDILSIHDYEPSGEVVGARYADAESVAALFSGVGPAGRRLSLTDESADGAPVMLTEFGGIKFTAGAAADDAWGYSTASSAADLAERLTSLLDGVRRSSVLAGYCYTQLTDTGQETNGLVTGDRQPKLPTELVRAIMTGIAVKPEVADGNTSTVEA